MNPFGRRVGGFSYPQIVGGYPQIVGSLADQQESLRRAARSSGMPLPQGSYPMGSPQVQEQAATTYREFPMGFFFAAVAKSGAQDVATRPQVIFRPSRLVIPAAVGANFSITDLRIGQRSQFVSATQLPSAIFSEVAVGVALTLDTAAVGNDITLSVVNTDAAATHDFSAALIGTCSQPAQNALVEALTEALAGVNENFLLCSPHTPALYDSGVVYAPPPNVARLQPWRDIPRLLQLGKGTCMDLAAWRVAEMRIRHNAGVAPKVTSTTDQRGRTMYHVVVTDREGRIEDPSAILGMKGSPWAHF